MESCVVGGNYHVCRCGLRGAWKQYRGMTDAKILCLGHTGNWEMDGTFGDIMSDGFYNYFVGFTYVTSFKALTINEVEG